MIARARLGSYRARLTPFFDTRARAAFAPLAAPVPMRAGGRRQILRLSYALRLFESFRGNSNKKVF